MILKNIQYAATEARRFLDRVRDLEHFLKESKEDETLVMMVGSKETGAVRRASLDLTRALAAMRRR